MKAKLTGVVLIEGPDGAGKTTLAQALCDRYDGYYVHRTWRQGLDVWDHHVNAVQIADELSHKQLVVIDRLWPSEAIYGTVFRKGSDYKHNSRAMDRVLQRMATVHVLCVPKDRDYVKKMHAQRAAVGGEMYSNIDKVIDYYHDWAYGAPRDGDLGSLNIVDQQAQAGGFSRSRHDWINYDVTSEGSDLPKVCDRIERGVRFWRSLQWDFALDPTTPNVLGHRHTAEFLFVGDRLGDLHSWSRWPFFARSYSPDFVNKSLHQIGWNEKRGAWTNAWDQDNRLPFIIENKPELKVICLGRQAERRCKQLLIPVHAAVPHPSFARRFNHHGTNGAPYHQLLKEALS